MKKPRKRNDGAGEVSMNQDDMKKRVFLSEMDATRILMRYSAATVMTLLREVAKCTTTKFDWNSLARKSTTGISNAREYQALWRHLAYRTELADTYVDDAEPSDNDSDLECDTLPTPAANAEEGAEAIRWVEADMQHIGLGRKRKGENKRKFKSKNSKRSSTSVQAHTSGSPRNGILKKVSKLPRVRVGDSGMASSPLGKVSKTTSDPDPESSRSRAAPGQTEKRKRKFWSPEEDQELIAAVEVHGEGNWTTLLKGSFTHERTAAQLSQRWALIKKRRGEAQAVTKVPPLFETDGERNVQSPEVPIALLDSAEKDPFDDSKTTVYANGSLKEEVAVETCESSRGLRLAIAPQGIVRDDSLPVGDSMESEAEEIVQSPEKILQPEELRDQKPPLADDVSCNGSESQSMSSGQCRNDIKIVSTCKTEVDFPSPVVIATAAQVAPVPAAGVSTSVKIANPNNAGNGAGKGTSVKSSTGPDPGVQAAAVAAGARIAPASAAASLLKAAQSGNVVHIGPDGLPVTKTNLPGQTGMPHNNSGTNVHYIRTGAAITTSSTHLGGMNPQRSTQSTKNQSLKTSTATQTNGSIVSALVPPASSTEASEPN